MKTCSSYTPSNCVVGTEFPANSKTEKTFSLDKAGLHRIETLAEKYADIHSFPNLKKLLSELRSLSDPGHLSRRDLLRWLDRYRLGKKVDALNNAEFYLFFDALEVAQQDEQGNRIKELAKPSHSKLQAAKSLNLTLKAQLQQGMHSSNQSVEHKGKPLMLFSTASARDIFDAVDFYQSNFEALGLSAKWWPLSPAMYKVYQARSAGDLSICDDMDSLLAEHYMFDRARVYPDLYEQHHHFCENIGEFEQVLSQAQGIFFNGGDQSKTLAAFMQNGKAIKLLALLKQYNREGQLFIAGTSAGTAVQSGGNFIQRPVPMISNGTSQNAILRGAFAVEAPSVRADAYKGEPAIKDDDLTYRSTGGLGSFSVGVLDTHFSERDRQARLIVLSAQTLSNYAFGVDETTGLLIGVNDEQAHFEVIGASGVFVVDNSLMQSQVMKQGTQNLYAYSAAHHYLQSGVSGRVMFANNEWKLSLDNAKQKRDFIEMEDGIWREQSFALCGKEINEQMFVLDNYKVALKKTEVSQVLNNPNGAGCTLLFIEHVLRNH